MADKKGFFSDIWQGFRSLPVWAQALISIVVIVMVWKAVTAILTYIKIKSEAVKANAEQSAYATAGEKLSYPESQYKTFADQLETALQSGVLASIDSTKVIDKINNNLDFLELKKAFGQRSFSGWFSTYSYNINEAIRAYLPEVSINKINQSLTERGIKYQY